jgi:uncharacterized protein (TIGR00255 family)
MIRSMTGYGEAERQTPAGRLRAEVRTVNHRFFSANLRLSPALERYESVVRDALRELLPRGHVSCTIRLERGDPSGDGEPALGIDESKARGYVAALRMLKDRLELPGEVDVALVSRFGDLFVLGEEPNGVAVTAEDARDVTTAAARATAAMRAAEGERLAADLEARLTAIARAVDRIEESSPGRLVRERDRLRRAVRDLLDGVSVDEDRIAREIAFLVEKWNIGEELVRLRSHIELFRATLGAPADEPVGKRLSFLIQEMNREANTIGSKANDAAIEHEVVGIKDEIERLREQIENVE